MIKEEVLEKFIEGHGGYWDGEHPRYPVDNWVESIRNGDTRQGYWEWAFYLTVGEEE
jgi:hypothetical protein